MEADRHERHRHPDLRGVSAARPDHGQARDRPLARRQPGRSRRDPGLQRPPPEEADADRRLAAVRLGGREAARPGRSRRRRRSSASVTPARTARTTSPAPASSARPRRRSGRWARRATTWSCAASRSTASPTARRLLKSFDTLRRDVDASGTMQGMDAFTQQAFGLLTSSQARRGPRPVARKTRGSSPATAPANPKIHMDGNGAPRVPQSLLMARRLVEAGVRVVTLNYSKWDWHGGRTPRAGQQLHLPPREGRLPGLRPVPQRPGRRPARPRAGRGLHA